MMGIKNFRIGLPCVLWLALSLGFVLVPAPLLAGNTTGTTRTQTYQPGEPFTGLPGGAPGRGYGTSPYGTPYGVVPYGTPYGANPYGAPSVYCQNWPGHSPYPQYPGTGPQYAVRARLSATASAAATTTTATPDHELLRQCRISG